MELDTNHLRLSDDELRDLMIYYATKNRQVDFEKLYREIYKDATTAEILRCAFFIRLALDLPNYKIGY
jgi:hypothetical protein